MSFRTLTSSTGLGEPYIEVLTLIARLHRRVLDSINSELHSIHRQGVTAAQALMLYYIGDRTLSAQQVMTDCYLGTNASYNLAKLRKMALISSQGDDTDKRKVRIALTKSGQTVRGAVAAMFDRHVAIARSMQALGDLVALGKELKKIEHFMIEQIVT
jgi:DNA-binding MarR family transcriptional regulator